jgi:hypothetical protein
MEPDRVPSVLDVLNRLDWHAEAACRDGEVDFFPKRYYEGICPGTPRVLLPLVVCSSCPVRRERLIAGLEGVQQWECPHCGKWGARDDFYWRSSGAIYAHKSGERERSAASKRASAEKPRKAAAAKSRKRVAAKGREGSHEGLRA